jgi:hypothetical protein
MSRNKHRRTFKLKRYPSIVRDGITHVHPPAGDQTSKAAARDQRYFLSHPSERSFLRATIPGEFAGIALPDGMRFEDIKYVLVKRLGDYGAARIPLTTEQTKRLEDPEYWRKVSGE